MFALSDDILGLVVLGSIFIATALVIGFERLIDRRNTIDMAE